MEWLRVLIGISFCALLPGQQEGGPLAQRLIEFHQQPSAAAQRARSPLPPNPARVVRHVRPRDADPAVTQFQQDHYAILHRGVPKNGLLFLFFPGTFGRPQNTQFVLDTAARAGYLALGLEYVNTTRDARRASVRSLCGGDRDLECAGKVRHERMFGEDASPLVEVGRADAIVTRVEKALALLAKEHPDDGWGRFLGEDGRVRWDLVAAGGHSQGAGMAAFLAGKFALARACLFSGGGDFSRPALSHAAWLKEKAITPAGRFYGMVHAKEASYRGIVSGYEVLGMNRFGPPKTWKPGGRLDGPGHVVTVSETPAKGIALGDPEHGSTASDTTTPKNADGTPVYRPVWEYIMGARDGKR